MRAERVARPHPYRRMCARATQALPVARPMGQEGGVTTPQRRAGTLLVAPLVGQESGVAAPLRRAAALLLGREGRAATIVRRAATQYVLL